MTSRLLTVHGKDRPLTHINKKGRPVSQCPHCRGLRRARASHVKCECGEKPHCKAECPKQESPENDKGESGSDHGDGGVEITSETSVFSASAPSTHVCCCSHGARCTCALKKEHLDPVPEMDFKDIGPPPSHGPRKPRLKTAQSENSLTVFTNGHHKPVHKLNDAAHQCGLPYKIPIPHSIPGKSDTIPMKPSARRSTDSLPLLKTIEQAPHQLQESICSAQQEVRLIKSEHGSPKARALPSYDGFDGTISPLEMRYPGYHQGVHSPTSDEYGYPYYASNEEQPPLSAGIVSPGEDWSAVDLPLGCALSASFSQPPSYASYDYNVSQPGLTTSSSGEPSEVDEYASHVPQYPIKQDHVTPVSPDVPDSNLAYRLSSTSSYMSMPQLSILSDSNLSSHDMDNFLHATASPTELEKSEYPGPLGSGSFSRLGFTVEEAQKRAHPNANASTEALGDLGLMNPGDELDSLWATTFNEELPYDLNSSSAEQVWIRQ